MIPLNIPFSVSGLAAVIVTLYLFATLSRRLGAVTKMRPYYRGFYFAMAAVAVAIGAAVLRQPAATRRLEAADGDRSIYIAVYYLPLIAAGIISLVIAYRYWGWLFRERVT